MALSLKKHEENIVQAWKSVLDEKNLCDWVLFGYDGQSNELKVESTGKYGLEELSQEFNPGKVLFAFCKVKNPKSNLPLFILINWVGEGAPLNRKSSSPQHLFILQKFLKYSSLTINARVEEDVEPEAIFERIKKTSTTDFDFSAKIQNECLENIGPISTNYVRIKPEKDINLNEKKKFWSNLEKEFDEIKKEKELKEKETKENERNLINNRLNNKKTIIENNSNDDLVVKKINKLKINSELSEREKFWAQEEEEENKQKKEENKKKLLEKKAIETEIKNRELSAKLIMNNFNNLSSNDVQIKKINAIDEINLEKKKLLSSIKNSINENEILENNSLSTIESELLNNNEQSSENQNSNEPSLEDYVNDLNETYVKEADLSNELYDNYLDNDKNLDDEDVDDEAYENEYCLDDKSLKLSPDYLSKRLFFEPLEDIQEEDEDCQDEEYQEEEDNQEEECLNEELLKFLEGKGKCAKALFDYQASDDTEISFDPNDIITNINQVFESWWEGLGPDNKLGLFPANYVQLLN